MRLRTKLAALAVTAGVAVTATAAFGYWSTSGLGSGNATSASSNGTVTLHASFAGGIYPGGSKSVSFTADNAGATDLFVGTIHLDSVSSDKVGCAVADFSMGDVVSNTPVLHGASGQALTGTGTLLFANDAVNSQDACKGANITLNLSSN